jgi:hypothetical protein
MFHVLIALQAIQGLSAVPPHEDQLRFVFVTQDSSARARISGTQTTPTKWSGSSFYRIVRRCGAGRVGVARNNGHQIVVDTLSGPGNVEVARCVKAATSVRFSVGTQEHGFGAVAFDQQPFRALWDHQLTECI